VRHWALPESTLSRRPDSWEDRPRAPIISGRTGGLPDRIGEPPYPRGNACKRLRGRI